MHLWRLPLELPDARVAVLAAALSADERARAEAFRFERDRLSFTVARGALRALLGAYLGSAPDAVAFRYGAQGKPRLADDGATLRFNVAHSGALALLAFTSGRDVGVDVEEQRPHADLMELAESVFSARELASLRALGGDGDTPAARQHDAFFRCWARKEAFIKATGEGLTRSLQGFDVTLHPNEPARLLRVEGVAAPLRWSLHDVPIDEGYAAALVVEGHNVDVRCFSFS